MSTELPGWARPRGSAEPVSVALGTMNFGKRTPAADAERILARAFERGVRVFDTANAYNDGDSERILGRALSAGALRGKRDACVVASKVGFGRVAGQPEGLAAERVRAACGESLVRLGVDTIDLYYLHVPDHATPIEETLSAVHALVESGTIRRFGVSNYASWQILEIHAVCRAIGLTPPCVAQQIYNLVVRQLDGEYFRFAARYGLHTTVYNPLAGGLLTGRYRDGDAIAVGSRFHKNRLYQGRYWSPRMLGLARDYAELAAELSLTPVALAYAWLAGSPGVDSILVGPATVAQLDEALDAVAVGLPADVRARIDAMHRAYLGTDVFYAR